MLPAMLLRRLPVILAPLCLCAALAHGATPPAPNVADLRAQYRSKSLARDDDRAEAQALRQQLTQLDAQLTQLRAVEAAGVKGIADKRTELAALNARDTSLQTQMGANQTDLAHLLGALELYRRDPPPALLITPRSAKDAVRAAILIRAAAPELARRAADLRVKVEDLQRLRRQMATLSEDLFTSESALAEGRAAIEKDLHQKDALQKQLESEAADADRSAQALARRLRSLGASLNGPATRAGAPDHAPTALRAPVDGQVVRRFGQSGGGPRSDGFSWRTSAGAVVRAPAAGLVEYAGALKGWGGVMILDLGGGYHLVLAGLDRMAATTGRPVEAGQAVGAMAERSLGQPELYMELRKEGEPQDPARWLRTAPLAQTAGRR